MDIKLLDLSSEEAEEINSLLLRLKINHPLTLGNIRAIMDQVWDDLGCDNNHLDREKISLFYAHPIWILNGLSTEQHQLSLQHRQAMADWIVLHKDKIGTVLDYGGGFGTLARLIVQKDKDITVDIYEPYPSQIAIRRIQDYPQIHFVNSITSQKYDCLVSTDVLEHLEDPLKIFADMIDAVNLEGYLLIANCFHPVIKCHISRTFHLRYTFNVFAQLMGLQVLGKCQKSMATIYQKKSNEKINWSMIRLIEIMSRIFFSLVNTLSSLTIATPVWFRR